MSRLILEAISCGRTTEARDELYLVVWPDDGAGKWIWGPKSINNGDTDTINAECDFDRHIHINLYNADPYAVLLNPDDNLGGYLIYADNYGEDQARFGPELGGVRAPFYTLSYEVVDSESQDSQRQRYRLDLLSLTCNDAQQLTDHAYITANDRRIWESDMKTGQTRDINQNIIFRELISVALWEKDSRNSDPLGSFQIRSEDLAINTGRSGDLPVNTRLSQTFRCDEGIVGDARYTLRYMIRHLPRASSPQPMQRYRLDLLSLACNDAQQSTDHVYIKANGERIWEGDMKTGQTSDINQNTMFNDAIRIDLWEEDTCNPDDHFGSFQIREDALAINTGRRGDIPVNARLNQTFRCDEGIVGDARYTLTYMIRQLSSEPRPQPPQRYRLDLISLTCNDAQQSTDHVYIMANGEIIWESDIRTGQSRDINQNIVFGDSIGVALWEEDAHGRDDYFGSFQIRSNDLAINTGIDGDVRINTRLNQTFRRDAGISGDARYTLRYMVRRLPG